MEAIPFQIPEPRKIRKAITPDQRKFCVMPLRAMYDKSLSLEDFRTLGLLCSYASKAGFTHVSQFKLAKDCGRHFQHISRNMQNLKRKGYVETILHGVAGLRGEVRRVIYDDKLSAHDVSAITSEPIDPFTINQEKAHYMNTVKPVRKRGRPSRNNQASGDRTLTFMQAVELVGVKDEVQLLQLERIYHDSITESELLAAWHACA